MNPKTYQSLTLRLALQNQFAGIFTGPVIFMNNTYCAATRSWVDQQFASYIWNFETARGQRAYRTRGNQCEHYALRAALEVVDLFRQMPDSAVPPDAESMAIGCFKYCKADGGGWHEANLWFLEGIWFPWEPQTRKFFTLTPSEKETVQEFIVP